MRFITPSLRLACLSLLLSVGVGCSVNSAPDFSRTPVIFVHGHGMSPNDWDGMIEQLSRAGYPQGYLHAVDIQPNVMANVEAAESVIAPAVETLLESAGQLARDAGYSGSLPQRVDIVSHSMGAMSSRWYAVRVSPERVRVWISVGGANHGTNVLCRYDDDGAADMCPAFARDQGQNPLQVSLNGSRDNPVDETPWGLGRDSEGRPRVVPDEARHIAWFTIRIDPDLWIEPAESAILDGAGTGLSVPGKRNFRETSPGNLLLLTRAIHDDLPSDEDVIDVVAMLLRQDYGAED